MPPEPVTSTGGSVQQATDPADDWARAAAADAAEWRAAEAPPGHIPDAGNMIQPTTGPLVEVGTTPSGYTLYRQENNAGGHTYWCDDIGGGRVVWDTCLDDFAILAQVLALEDARLIAPALAGCPAA